MSGRAAPELIVLPQSAHSDNRHIAAHLLSDIGALCKYGFCAWLFVGGRSSKYPEKGIRERSASRCRKSELPEDVKQTILAQVLKRFQHTIGQRVVKSRVVSAKGKS